MEDTKWVKWEPKVGDVPPEGCQYRAGHGRWSLWADPCNDSVDGRCCEYLQFRIPAPVQEVRPPWIDPQCKFRWGDRVKTDGGAIRYVIHPFDVDDPWYPVVIAGSISTAPAYSTGKDLIELGIWDTDSTVDGYREDDLTLCPEDLPEHYDDTQQPVKKPLDFWVVVGDTGRIDNYMRPATYPTKEAAESWWKNEDVTYHHMREVLE